MIRPALLVVASVVFSYVNQAHANEHYWQIQWDNDVLVGTDGNFTNGVALSLGKSLVLNKANATPARLNLISQFQQVLTFEQEAEHAQISATLSQRIFTPEDFENPQVQIYDRPYAGYVELQSYYGQFSPSRSQKNWLAIGYIGQDSGGQYVHETVHDMIGSPAPMGWHYQIEEQVTAQFAYQADYLIFREAFNANKEWELSTYSYSQIGNYKSETNLGLILRSSRQLADSFGFLSPHYAHSSDWSSLTDSQWLYYGYAHVGYRFNDLTIDGDLPYQTPIEVNHVQISTTAGVIYPYSGFAFGFKVNAYTKAFKQDSKHWHAYASLSLSGML
ncbi:lipid A-modifier LpxR family protein [Thalassotalea sp. PLHSN55]|uniref:lipid A-modifier LpxR family protein n=1 Tax=Thalassotalea sp. PLHSN55 TaxID=3435888 RepID=UPI003F84F462